jgi:PAS domain S-box-containing protein
MVNQKKKKKRNDPKTILEANQEIYRSLVEDQTEIICRFLRDGTITFVNEVYCRFFGSKAKDLIGQKWHPNALSEDLPYIEDRLNSLSSSNQVVIIENRVYSASGQIHWMQFVNRGFFDAQGQLTEIQAVGRDITELKNTEEKLRKSQAAAWAYADDLAAVLAQTPAITFVARDPDCRSMVSSRAALELLRLPADANTSKSAPLGERPETFRVLKNGRELPPEELPVQIAAFTGHEVKNAELTLVMADSTERELLGNAAPLFDIEGKVRGAVGAFLDITERKQIEAKFRSTSAYVRSLIDISQDALVTINIEGKIMDVNPATCDATGLSREKLIGTDFANYFTQPDQARAGYLQAFTQGRVTDFPLTFRHVSGQCMEVLYNATTYLNDKGEVAGIFADARDITEWKKTEAALRRSQTELKAIYENAPIMMVVLDASRQVLYANQAFAEFVGRPSDEIKQERACGVIGCLRALDDPRGCGYGPQCDDCNVRKAMREALETGRVFRGIEYRTTALYRGAPRESVFLVSVAPIMISEQRNLLLCLEDITDRQRIEEELRYSQEKYRLLVDASLDAVFLTSPDGTIFGANKAACQMFGRSEQELVQVGRDGILDASLPKVHASLEQRSRTGTFHGELTFIRSDGSKFPGEISSALFRDNRGELRASVIVRDISERRRAEEELRTSHEQLRALAAHMESTREEERSAIAREIHDVLSQELIRLKFELVWLERQLSKLDGLAELKPVASKVTELKKIADLSIDFARNLATGLRPAVLDSLGLCGTVDWQIRDFQNRTRIRCDAEVPEAEIPVDPNVATNIFRILQESLANVFRHSHADFVSIRLREEAGEVVLTVMDNGCGIPSDNLNSPSSFGLIGMRERALLQGGKLEIRSLPESGTTVEARIPSTRPTDISL